LCVRSLERRQTSTRIPRTDWVGRLRLSRRQTLREAKDEIRFVLMPPKPEADLDPLFLEMGSLKDISTPLFPEGGA